MTRTIDDPPPPQSGPVVDVRAIEALADADPRVGHVWRWLQAVTHADAPPCGLAARHHLARQQRRTLHHHPNPTTPMAQLMRER